MIDEIELRKEEVRILFLFQVLYNMSMSFLSRLHKLERLCFNAMMLACR